ncbi:allatostatin-A receptor-like [Amphiura filiformis]|uniref:allatostatin-A receptor-like n=1 Tax=Amphiura filiformis TaxID=82378 RepID=UPI003B212820
MDEQLITSSPIPVFNGTVCVVIFSPDDVLPIPNWACGIVGASSFICVGCSVYTLASIGTYRFILLKDVAGRVAPKFQKPSIAVFWIATTWIIPVLVNVIPHVIGAGHLGFNENYHACGAQTSHPRHRELEIAQTFGMYLIPFIIIIVTYTLIFVAIRRHTNQMVRRLSIRLSTSSSGHSLNRDSERTRQIRQRQIIITRNMFYVVLAFIVCLTPYAICLVFPDLNGQLYAAAFVSANSCINPFLYGFKHPHFGDVFKALLKCQCGQVPERSPALKRLLRITSTTSDM